jgi:hypothetical protein
MKDLLSILKPKRRGFLSEIMGRFSDNVHWRLWRLALAQLSATRARFWEMACALECTGDKRDRDIARDIKNILTTKF